MNEIQNIETKVENGGSTPQGRVSADEFNILTDAAKRFDVSKYGAARITADNLLQFFADADSMASYEANPQTNAALLLKSLSLPTSNIDISGKLDKAEFYRYFEEVNIGTAEEPQYVTRSKRSLFTDGFLSSLGLNPGMGGGGDGGGTTYNRLDLWGDYTSERAGWVLSAALGYELHNRVSSLESNIVPDLSAYATRTWVQQQGYATSAALAAHAGNTTLHVTSSERSLWNRTAADFAAIVGADSDQIINKWEEVVAFLDTYTEADTLANLLSNKVDKVTGYGLSKNDFTDALLSKLNGIEAGANRYVHPTGGADAAIDDAAGRVLAGITVNALGHVTSVSSKTLAAADIPTLSISKVSGLQDALDGKLDAATFDDLFEKVNIGTTSAPKYAIRAKYGLYADGFLSSLGLNSSSGGGTGGASYDRLDLWSDYTSERAGWVLSAGLGYDLYNRVRSLEGGSALSFTDEGAGNVVTAVKKSGTSVTVTKGLTALTSHQTIYALNFQAGAFEAKKYTPNTGAQTVNIPTKTSHLSNDSGFITAAALTGYATQSWVQGLGYITATTANATFATKLGVSGNQIGTYVNGKLGNLITVPYAANADTVDGLHKSSLGQTFYNIALDANDYENLPYLYAGKLFNATNVPYTYYPFLHFGGGGFYAQFSAYGNALKFRASRESDYTPEWRTVAFTDSNVASATKLQTARTLWGNSFNGEQNVGGDIVFDRGKNNRLLKITKDGILRLDAGTGAWTFALNTYSDGGDIQTGSIGTLGSGNDITYWYIGKSHEEPKLVITPSGNVGIGTLNPAYKLDVVGSIQPREGIVAPYTGSNWLSMATRTNLIYSVTNNGTYSAHALYRVKDNKGNAIIFGGLGADIGFYGFSAESIAAGTNMYTWRTTWNVATGNLLTSGNITVEKSGSNPAKIIAKNGNGTISIDNTNNRGLYDDSTTRWLIGTNGVYTFLMGGNVGIGNFNPAYKLDVTGVVHATAGIFSDSYMSAKGINTASDVRLKRRIADVALTVRDVAEAPVYRFAWINGGGIDVGSTAQYWAARVPELTHLLADGKHLGLDYGKAALLSVVAVARSTADHERRIADIERQLQNRTI